MNILVYPDPILKQVSRPITDAELASGSADGIILSKLIDDMSIILEHRGIGLAAIQVGIPFRIFLVKLPNASSLIFINPELSNFGKPIGIPEGCLSFPGVDMTIRRPETVHVVAKNLQGTTFELDAEAMKARIILHEYDHLDGRALITRGNVTLNRRNVRALEHLENSYAMQMQRMAIRAKRAEAEANHPNAGSVTFPVTPEPVYGKSGVTG
jgi:peptide deformylase